MRTLYRTTSLGEIKLEVPNYASFIYSRQPVIITFPNGAAGVTSVDIQLKANLEGGGTHTESRTPYSSVVEFDISRSMQLVAPDVDGVSKILDEKPANGLSIDFILKIYYTSTDGTTTNLATEYITGLYGALDQGETYGEPLHRRLWVNFPQTFNLWRDQYNKVQFVLEEGFVAPDVARGVDSCYECDLMQTLYSKGREDLIESLKRGVPLPYLGFTWRYLIEPGKSSAQPVRPVYLTPDCSKRSDGTYLRWLNRRGEMSYWLFKNSKMRVTTSVADSFVRYYSGDPASPANAVFQNPQKASYREAREMVLGAVGLSRYEFDDLCDLATSPVVERLLPDSDPDLWQRVNVVAGTFERDIKRQTPRLQDLEIIIELPERNTIKL